LRRRAIVAAAGDGNERDHRDGPPHRAIL